jgi:acylphosphatase
MAQSARGVLTAQHPALENTTMTGSAASETAPRLCRHLRISGRVQGVGYRAALCAEARARALSGWVRNCRDGSVEAILCGPPEAVEALTSWARTGPPWAHVEALIVSDHPADVSPDTLHGFEQRPTY